MSTVISFVLWEAILSMVYLVKSQLIQYPYIPTKEGSVDFTGKLSFNIQ